MNELRYLLCYNSQLSKNETLKTKTKYIKCNAKCKIHSVILLLGFFLTLASDDATKLNVKIGDMSMHN